MISTGYHLHRPDIEQQYLIPRAGGYSETESLWNQRLYAEGAKIALNSTQDHFSKQYEAWLKTVWDSIPKKLLDGASIEDLTVQMTAFFNILLRFIYREENFPPYFY